MLLQSTYRDGPSLHMLSTRQPCAESCPTTSSSSTSSSGSTGTFVSLVKQGQRRRSFPMLTSLFSSGRRTGTIPSGILHDAVGTLYRQQRRGDTPVPVGEGVVTSIRRRASFPGHFFQVIVLHHVNIIIIIIRSSMVVSLSPPISNMHFSAADHCLADFLRNEEPIWSRQR